MKALLEVFIELRQLLDAIELELDARRLGLGDSLGTALRLPPVCGDNDPLARRPRLQVSSSAGAGGAGGGASRLIIKEVTLLAVADIPVVTSTDEDDIDGPGSSTGDIRPACCAKLAELALPKLNFHFDGFLVTGSDVVDVDACACAGDGVTDNVGEEGIGGGAMGWLLDNNGVGRAYIATGSYGPSRRRRADDVVEVVDGTEEVADRIEDTLEALLISRASDCDATAKVASVSSFGVVGVPMTAPLPLRVPRFLLLLVEVEREVIRISCGSSCSCTDGI